MVYTDERNVPVVRKVRALAVVLVALAGGALAAPGLASAKTFYVSRSGSDTNSGLSPDRPWRTVERVDKARLHPGDHVLFQGGGTYDDDALMPGWGKTASGTGRAPIVFSTYGDGQAILPQGIWFKHERHLVFQNFTVGPAGGIGGYGSDGVVEHCTLAGFMGQIEIPLNIVGHHWLITDNYIDHTGDSGMLIRGSHFAITDNTITNTGLDPKITYGSHGIYLKAAKSTVSGNTIKGFRNNGVSVRYLGSTVENNTISGGQFGIAYFQGSKRTGLTRFIDNTISDTSIAGIYVSPYGIGGRTHERMVIADNKIYRPSGTRASIASVWQPVALSHNKRRYHISGNTVL